MFVVTFSERKGYPHNPCPSVHPGHERVPVVVSAHMCEWRVHAVHRRQHRLRPCFTVSTRVSAGCRLCAMCDECRLRFTTIITGVCPQRMHIVYGECCYLWERPGAVVCERRMCGVYHRRTRRCRLFARDQWPVAALYLNQRPEHVCTMYQKWRLCEC
jgi:hypothetical protein